MKLGLHEDERYPWVPAAIIACDLFLVMPQARREREKLLFQWCWRKASSSSLSDGASHQFRLSGYHLWPINEWLLQQKRRKWYLPPRVGYSFKTSAFRGLVIQLSWWRTCSTFTRPWIQFPVPYKLGMVTQSHNPCIWEMKSWRSEVQSHPQLHAEFKAILQHLRLCL